MSNSWIAPLSAHEPTLDARRSEVWRRIADADGAAACFSVDGVLLDANPQFLDLFGYRLEDASGHSYSEFLDAFDVNASGDGPEGYVALWKRLGAGATGPIERRRRRADGRPIWTCSSFSVLLDADGNALQVVEHVADVTREKLRHLDCECQVVAINKSHAVIAFDMNGVIVEANDLFLSAFGYELDEIVGRHHRMFVEPSYSHGAEYAAFWRQLTRGDHHAGQFKRYGKDGREIWLQATYNPVFDMSGAPIKVVKFATVVTEDRMRQADHQGQIAAIHNAQCVISFDLDGNILDANDNFLSAMNYRLVDVIGLHHRIFVPPEEREGPAYAAFWRDLSNGRHQAGEFKRIARDGREVWLRATYNPILDMNGRPFRVVKYAIDVTREKLRQVDYEGQIAAIDKSQAVIAFTIDGKILDVNDNALRILGYERADMVGRHHGMLVDPVDTNRPEYAKLWATLHDGHFVSGLYKRLAKNGREVWVQATYNPILDLNGRPYKIIKFASDVTSEVQLAEAYEDAKRQAMHDAVTSLPNRVRLAAFMAAALARPDARLPVLCLDLDRFKPINDTFGHHVGDLVLGEVADRLRRLLSEEQLIARVGGDEFVIVAPGLEDEEIEALCGRLLAAANAPIHHDAMELKVGVSIGVAISPADGVTPDQLLRCADAALYRSKQNGRGMFSFYADETNERSAASRSLIEDVRKGLASGQFFLEYLPRFDARSRRIRVAEALIRWLHPVRGRVCPTEFLPLAERNGLIVAIGAFMLETACRAAAAWPEIGVSVQVSSAQFREGDIAAIVAAALTSSALEPHRLELEIPEDVLLDNAARARGALDGLAALGVTFQIKGFGAGYSLLNVLRDFPVHSIKIDTRSVAEIEDRDGRDVLRALLGLGKALRLRVTADGVETERQLALLAVDGCDDAQGAGLARPMPFDGFSGLLAGIPTPAARLDELAAELRRVAGLA